MRYYEIYKNDGIDALKYNVHKLITLYKGTIPNIMKDYNLNGLHQYDQYKKVAAKLRPIIARSDNKLQTLQKEILRCS